MIPLTVYKASAGSGKTFTLAVRYISLLIANPMNYREILAVTFTNKATAEMKARIMSQLFGIAHGLSSSKAYLDAVKANISPLGLGDEEIIHRAAVALHLLVHNYSYFRVQTIDTFFQSVLRNLARELDLTPNLRIELNDQEVMSKAVDRLIDNLDAKSPVLRWILDYIRENIDEAKGWNVIGSVKQFGRNIFRDYYKENSKAINDLMQQKDFFKNFTSRMHKIRSEADKALKDQAQAFFSTLEAAGMQVTDLSRGISGVAGYFKKIGEGNFADKILGKTVVKGMTDPSAWLRAKECQPGNEHYTIVVERLMPLLRATEEMRPQMVSRIKSASQTLEHISELRLLGTIEKATNEVNEENNQFLLSNTQTILKAMIGSSDAPFIYEKIGARLRHVMIDEFQDTSTVQWQNFKVLLEDCMAHRNAMNLVVGDVKQSIYRWRGGDWRLLNNIESQFSNASERVDIENLKTNRRSRRNIILFNNHFFQIAAALEAEALAQDDTAEGGSQLSADSSPAPALSSSAVGQDGLSSRPFSSRASQLIKAYSDVAQEFLASNPAEGLVSVQLIKPDADANDRMMEMTLSTVRSLIAQGVEPSGVAILMRGNKAINELATYFMREAPELRLISDEAFRLDSSLAVRMIVMSLHCLTHSTDILSLATLAKEYQSFILHKPFNEESLILNHSSEDSSSDAQQDAILRLLPQDYANHFDNLLQLPLTELMERIYEIFRIESVEGEGAYVCAFFDQVEQYLENNIADIDALLKYWDETLRATTIQSDATDGIRVMTIHKSKGLEFDNVIMPFCNWQLENSKTTVWCRPDEAPYNELPLVPVKFNPTQMKGSVYEQDYQEEHLQNVVDNLNLLYVSFTRPKKNLFVMGLRRDARFRSMLLEQALPQVADELNAIEGGPKATFEEDVEKGEITFTYGDLDVEKKTPKHKPEAEAETAEATSAVQEENVFETPIEAVNATLKHYKSHVKFRQSNDSRDFLAELGDEEEQRQAEYIRTGNILHRLFSTIRTIDDIEPALQQMEFDGVVYGRNMTRKKFGDMIRKRFENPIVRSWFSHGWELFNECSILGPDPDDPEGKMQVRRPDRVMKRGEEIVVVDFKFGKPREEYITQVNAYKRLLQGIGYQNVKGYLWFVYSNRIEEV